MTAVRIVTTPYPDTVQRVVLDGLVYTLRLLWSERGACWHLDLADGDGAAILSGIRLVTSFPLLYRYRYLAVPPGELFFFDLKGSGDNQTLADMGTRLRLYYVDSGGFT